MVTSSQVLTAGPGKADGLGGAAKRLQDRSPGPWTAWRTKSRHARCIRFCETYCRPPKGHGHGKPLKLGRFQREWLEEVLADGVDVGVQSIPRGNGKSTFRAAVALWAVFDDDETGAPQVPIVATTIRQALKSLYTPAMQMVDAEPELAGRCIRYTAIGDNRLWVPRNNGELYPISNDVAGLQGLDPSLAVVDELAFMNMESWIALTESTGKRDRSLVVGISTPGVDRNNALWGIRSQVLNGVDLPGFRYSEYAAPEGCKIDDEEAWRAANPAIDAGFLRIDALRSSVARTPETMFRIFRLGQWAEGAEGWLGPEGRQLWDSLCAPFEFTPGAPTWVGLDVGLYRDSTALVWVQERGDGRLHAKCKVWAPAPGLTVDVNDVMQYVRQLDRDYLVRAVSYDPRFFDYPAQALASEGIAMMEIPQSLERMTPICGNAYEALKRGEITHDRDDVFAAHVMNGVCKFNDRGFTLQKSKAKGRIDAAVALCLSLERYYAQPVVSPVTFGWA